MTDHDILLPNLPGGAATVLAWLARPGEPIASGAPIALLLTACAELLLPAPLAGALAEPVEPGETVAPGGRLARLALTAAPAPPEARLRATPLAHAIARRHGLDLASLAGTGPRGQIRAADVRALLSDTVQTGTAAQTSGSELQPIGWTHQLTYGPAHLKAAAANERSAGAPGTPALELAAMPTATATLEFDAGAALRRVAAEGAACARCGLPLSLTTVVVEAVAALLPAHMLLNAAWAGEAALLRRRQHIAVGEPGPDGLCWALVRDAGDLTLRGLARAIAAPEQDQDAATFAMVSLAAGAGWLGAQPPLAGTTAALSLSAPAARPVACANAIAIRPMAALTLSYDARLIDHHGAVAFLHQLRDRLERKVQAAPEPR